MESVHSNGVELVIKTVGSEDIVIQDTKEIDEKGEELETTQYFLDVEEQATEEEGEEGGHFASVDDDQEENQETQYVEMEVEDSDRIILQDKDVILWNKLCRICANDSDRLIPIFSGEGLEHNLCNKIHSYLPMQVSETDSLPIQVCYNCAATLLAWHEMTKGCLDAQQRLMDLQIKFNLKEQYYNDTIVEDENIQAILEVEATNDEESEVQARCGNNMESVQVLNISESDRCVKLEDEGMKLEADDVIAILMTSTSPKSEKKRKSKDQLSPDVKQSRSGGRGSRSKKEGASAADTDGSRSLQRRLEVARSKISIDGVTYYKCRSCSKLLSTAYNYFAHKRIHTREKLFTCDICSKSFTVTSSLTRHVRDVHDKIKDYSCNYCERSLASKIARDEHQRTHTNERPHVCDTCGKTFRQRASLSVHKRFHSNNFSFRCGQCDRAFPRKQDMERHELTHTDQKPYGCKVCGKSFRSSASAIRHRQTHEVFSIHICDVCGESFTQERYLKSHKSRWHKYSEPDN